MWERKSRKVRKQKEEGNRSKNLEEYPYFVSLIKIGGHNIYIHTPLLKGLDCLQLYVVIDEKP